MRIEEEAPVCRICLDTEPESDLFSPCDCRGSGRWIHRGCLDTWIRTSPAEVTACGVCKAAFQPVAIDELVERRRAIYKLMASGGGGQDSPSQSHSTRALIIAAVVVAHVWCILLAILIATHIPRDVIIDTSVFVNVNGITDLELSSIILAYSNLCDACTALTLALYAWVVLYPVDPAWFKEGRSCPGGTLVVAKGCMVGVRAGVCCGHNCAAFMLSSLAVLSSCFGGYPVQLVLLACVTVLLSGVRRWQLLSIRAWARTNIRGCPTLAAGDIVGEAYGTTSPASVEVVSPLVGLDDPVRDVPTRSDDLEDVGHRSVV